MCSPRDRVGLGILIGLSSARSLSATDLRKCQWIFRPICINTTTYWDGSKPRLQHVAEYTKVHVLKSGKTPMKPEENGNSALTYRGVTEV